MVKIVDEHFDATRFLDEHEVPGDKLLQRVRWLHDKATQTIVQETAEFFAGVDLGFPEPVRTTIVEVRGEDVRVVDASNPTIPAPPQLPSSPLFRCKHRKIPGDGGFVDGCGWQGYGADVPFLACPACGSPHVRRLLEP